ncbi:MAG: hypothetical protein KF861_16665, partial [Planctomycetaceae bacterium]|nr:hypothetical protein [Planctomycetaceae bacterium]
MPRKRTPPPTVPSQRAADAAASTVITERLDAAWLPTVAAVLVTARFFLPAESAAQGETLWIVLAWLMCGLCWMLHAWRNQATLRRPDALTAAVWMLVLGHVASAVHVLLTEGDRRAALNMLWEWVGMGVAALLMREAVRSRMGRTRMLQMVVLSGMVLSGYGLWQHYVWYPRIAAQFAELESLQSGLTATEASAAPDQLQSRRRRIGELQRELGWTPRVDDASSQMFRDRVQASTEPIGRFALANTFAGLLLTAAFLGLSAVWR